jgi:hypothetical protein
VSLAPPPPPRVKTPPPPPPPPGGGGLPKADTKGRRAAAIFSEMGMLNQFVHLGCIVDFNNMTSQQHFPVSTTFFDNISNISTTILISNNIFRQHFQQQFPRFLTTFSFFDNIFSTTF